MQPRAQFLCALLLSTAAVCVTAACTLLAMFCIVKARQSTSLYDSSASAVAATWLVVMTFIITAVRAKFVSMAWPCAAALVFSNYGLVYSTEFTNIHQAMAFLQQLLLAHLAGFAISLGISLLFFPTTSYRSFAEAMRESASTVKACLEANCFLRKMLESKNKEGILNGVSRVRQTTSALAVLQMKLAKTSAAGVKEIAISGPKAHEVEGLYYRMREVLTSLAGTQHLADVAEKTMLPPQDGGEAVQDNLYMTSLMNAMARPLDQACSASSNGIETAMRQLGLEVGQEDHHDSTGKTGTVHDYNVCIAQLQDCFELGNTMRLRHLKSPHRASDRAAASCSRFCMVNSSFGLRRNASWSCFNSHDNLGTVSGSPEPRMQLSSRMLGQSPATRSMAVSISSEQHSTWPPFSSLTHTDS